MTTTQSTMPLQDDLLDAMCIRIDTIRLTYKCGVCVCVWMWRYHRMGPRTYKMGESKSLKLYTASYKHLFLSNSGTHRHHTNRHTSAGTSTSLVLPLCTLTFHLRLTHTW